MIFPFLLQSHHLRLILAPEEVAGMTGGVIQARLDSRDAVDQRWLLPADAFPPGLQKWRCDAASAENPPEPFQPLKFAFIK